MPKEPTPKSCIDCGAPITRKAVRCSSCAANRRLGRAKPAIEPPNPSGLCMCGCGQMTRLARQTSLDEGTVKGQPRRFLPGHCDSSRPADFTRYTVDEHGCWIWQGAVVKGRPAAKIDGKTIYVHRHLYEQMHGPIPDGFEGHHVCIVGLCVNPDHIQPLSITDHRALHKTSRAVLRQRFLNGQN